MDFDVTWATRAGAAVVTIDGEVDLSVVPELREVLAAAGESGCRCVVVDLAGVTFVDAAGLGAMLGAARAAERRGGRLTLAGAGRAVRRVLEVTGTDDRLGLHPSVEAALASNRSILAPAGGPASGRRRLVRIGT